MGYENGHGRAKLPDIDDVKFLGPYEKFRVYVAAGSINPEIAFRLYQQAISSFKFGEAANIAGDISERFNHKVLAGLLESNSYDWEGLARQALSQATQGGNGHRR